MRHSLLSVISLQGKYEGQNGRSHVAVVQQIAVLYPFLKKLEMLLCPDAGAPLPLPTPFAASLTPPAAVAGFPPSADLLIGAAAGAANAAVGG